MDSEMNLRVPQSHPPTQTAPIHRGHLGAASSVGAGGEVLPAVLPWPPNGGGVCDLFPGLCRPGSPPPFL
jgi:hypothetical protein